MNKAIDLFDKILIDGQEISLTDLDTNNGIYAAGIENANKTINVDFILKKKNEVPAKLFTGCEGLKSVKLADSITTIGSYAFANTGATITGIKPTQTIGFDAFNNTHLNITSEEFEEIKRICPEAFLTTYTAAEAAEYNLQLPNAYQYGKVKVEGVSESWTMNGTKYSYNPTEEVSYSFHYVHDKASWEESFNNGGLHIYYEKYPGEDLWYNYAENLYRFTSYADAEKTTQYATGIIELVNKDTAATDEYFHVKVFKNSLPGFVDHEYYVAYVDNYTSDTVFELKTDSSLETSTNIFVTIDGAESVRVGGEVDRYCTFESWSAETGGTKWGDGKAQVLHLAEFHNNDYTKVKVVKNNSTDANAEEFVGREFYLSHEAVYVKDSDARYQLYLDSAFEQPTGIYINITNDWYPYCRQRWEGAVNASGAKYPWIVPYFTSNANVKIKFKYEGKEDVMPWNDTIFGAGAEPKVWGTASVAEEFKDNTFLIPQNAAAANNNWYGTVGEESTFDINKFKMIVIHQDEITHTDAVQEVLYSNQEVDEYNANLTGAVKEGDVKDANFDLIGVGDDGKDGQGL